jgi:tetratricopeptide (TPR) repeat protein
MRACQAGLLVVLGILAGGCAASGTATSAAPPALSSGLSETTDFVCGTNNTQANSAYNQAHTYQTNGEADASILSYQEAIELDPGFCDAMDNLGVLLRAQGRTAEAIEWYQKSIALAPDNPTAHMNLGVALNEQGDLDGAETEYLALVEIDPANPEGHYGLGMADLARGNPLDAVPHLMRAKELYQASSSPLAADADFQLGVAYATGEDCATALTYFESLYLANTENPALNYYMGMCYLDPATEDMGLAKKHLSAAQRLGIDLPEELSSVLE